MEGGQDNLHHNLPLALQMELVVVEVAGASEDLLLAVVKNVGPATAPPVKFHQLCM